MNNAVTSGESRKNALCSELICEIVVCKYGSTRKRSVLSKDY